MPSDRPVSGPRWTTVKPYSDAKYADIECDGHRLWAEASDGLPEWLAYENWDALVQCVRDADTLHRARETAEHMKALLDEGFPINARTLLDLLTQDGTG